MGVIYSSSYQLIMSTPNGNLDSPESKHICQLMGDCSLKSSGTHLKNMPKVQTCGVLRKMCLVDVSIGCPKSCIREEADLSRHHTHCQCT